MADSWNWDQSHHTTPAAATRLGSSSRWFDGGREFQTSPPAFFGAKRGGKYIIYKKEKTTHTHSHQSSYLFLLWKFLGEGDREKKNRALQQKRDNLFWGAVSDSQDRAGGKRQRKNNETKKTSVAWCSSSIGICSSEKCESQSSQYQGCFFLFHYNTHTR